MIRSKAIRNWLRASLRSVLALSALGLLYQAPVQAFTLNVEGCAGTTCTPFTGPFRFQVEEDNTTLTLPQTVQIDPPSAGLDIHKSYAPIVAQGEGSGPSVNVTLPDGRYFVTVLPGNSSTAPTHAIGGAPNYRVVAGAGGPAVEYLDTVTVQLNEQELPTAQIAVFVHTDHNPINNVWDEYDGGLSGEAVPNPPPLNGGLGGASVRVDDAMAGQVSYDVFGNPLGTQYDPGTGEVTVMGTGVITTMTVNDVDDPLKNPYGLKVGEALIKNIAPGKYGITVVPPQQDTATGAALDWIQTSTIEGTPTIDAWVKANEPRIFIEGFGQGVNHAEFGFVKVSPLGESQIYGQSVKALPWNLPSGDPDYVDRSGSGGSISGVLRLNHFSRPPNLQGYFAGPPVPECWVGLNDPLATPGLQPSGLYAAPCNPDGSFTIDNVPDGTYQLVWWDAPLDFLFGFRSVTVENGAPVDLGDVLAFRWFGALEGTVFFDANQNGFRDPGEQGLPNQNVNLRFRDGSIYQFTPTDLTGEYELGEVFPFFKWLVPEVDFARFKATGLTYAVDYGGEIISQAWPANGNKALQPQAAVNPNTGDNLSATEEGAVLTKAMHLFLGQTNLMDWGKFNYSAGENGGISGIVFNSVTRAENDPRYGAAEGWETGIPRVQVCLYQDANNDLVIDNQPGSPTAGVDLCDVDNYPFGWADGGSKGIEDEVRSGNGNLFNFGDAVEVATTDSWDDAKPSGCIQDLPVVHGITAPECADGFGTWNQIRDGVFDGGYAFGPDLATGRYIVESVMPHFYRIVTEEDKNVDFGEAWVPSPLLLPPVCVGTPANDQPEHIVPNVLTLFPDVSIDPPLAASVTPLCNMKQVQVKQGQNAAADFQFVTDVPKAARAVGFANNDLGAEFNQASPIFGEKLAAAWIPVSFKDWSGKEITRVYTDEFGSYNALLPSTYSVNVPSPSGVSAQMITLVLNDPTLPDGTQDPYYNPTYAVTPWTFHYLPGKTSYLDTPTVPVRAFAAAGTAFSTAPPNATPVIESLSGNGLICTDADPLPAAVTLSSLGPTAVIDPVTGTNVTLDYGFGNATGTVTLNGAPVVVGNWTNDTIDVTIPTGATTGSLMVTRGGAGGLSTEIGAYLLVQDCTGITVRNVLPAPGTPIQNAIDAADAGDVILVGPGSYNENVVMYKPVHLQGAGAGSTFINANPSPLDRLQAFHAKVDNLGARDFAAFLLKDPFTAAEAPGVFVMGELTYPDGNLQTPGAGPEKTLNPGNPFNVPSSIANFTLSGSKAGGGIFAVAGASDLTVSSNNVTNNQGNLAGGIGIGTPDVGFDSQNDNVVIRDNKVHTNGGVDGSGGIAMNEGSERYLVEGNLVTGNFSRFNGGGIAHNGPSPTANANDYNIIRGNRILFNEVFFGALLNQAGDGGGIFVGDSVAGVEGTGNVRIERNLIQGNLTGSGSGAGIRAFAVNAADVAASPANPANWYKLDIVNNIIVNNVAGVHGGGISLQDVLRATVVNNTIAHNDSTATGALAFEAGAANSTPQPVGISSGTHSAALEALIDYGTLTTEPHYANPVLVNNIVWQNRSFYNDASLFGGAGGLALFGDWDLGVIDTGGLPLALNPHESILTALTGWNGEDYDDGTNSVANPDFVLDYVNNLQSTTIIDEGGNNINVLFEPLDPAAGDYHIVAGSPAVDAGTSTGAPADDYDGETRGASVDIGADELVSGGPPPSVLMGYFSTLNNATPTGLVNPPGVTADDSDIYSWSSNGSTHTFARVFDASATVNGFPGGADVDAFVYNAADDIYVSFKNNFGVNLPGVGAVQDEDIVHWDGTAWTMYFDGSDVGLGDSHGEDVDGFAINGGNLLISTVGNPNVGLPGTEADEDLLSCNGGTRAAATSCDTWSYYFDGSDVGLGAASEDLDFAKLVGGNIHLSTLGTFAATGGLTGTGSDVFSCNSPTTGAATACGSFSTVLTFPAVGDTIDAINTP